MKIARKLVSLICGVVLTASLAACGGADNSSVSSDSAAVSPEQATIVQSLPQPDTALKDDSVLGDWTDIYDDSRYTKITKSDTGYQYQDPEATYTATFADGVLKVQVNADETADVYFDAASGNLVSVYQGSASWFKK